MYIFRYLLIAILVLASSSAEAADVTSLAACTTKVFSDIHRKQAWSGKKPSGCFARVSVVRKAGGLAVSAWFVEKKGDGWRQLSFTAVESVDELQSGPALAAANRDVMARAKRLERCFASGAGECQIRGSNDVLADEESGSRDVTEITLADGGREAVVEYIDSDTEATPNLPATIADDQPLPPGTELKVFTVR